MEVRNKAAKHWMALSSPGSSSVVQSRKGTIGLNASRYCETTTSLRSSFNNRRLRCSPTTQQPTQGKAARTTKAGTLSQVSLRYPQATWIERLTLRVKFLTLSTRRIVMRRKTCLVLLKKKNTTLLKKNLLVSLLRKALRNDLSLGVSQRAMAKNLQHQWIGIVLLAFKRTDHSTSTARLRICCISTSLGG